MGSQDDDDDHFHILQWHFIDINHSTFFHSYNTHPIFLLLSFFALLILIATFFLLAHFCRRWQCHLPPDSPAPAEADQSGGGDDEKWVIKYEMESLGHKMMNNNMDIECCICLSVLKEDEKVKVLPECEHVYHSECVEKWLISHPSCPLCRASLHNFICNAL